MAQLVVTLVTNPSNLSLMVQGESSHLLLCYTTHVHMHEINKCKF